MSVFDRCKVGPVDQTDPVQAEIQGTENFNGYTEYIVNVTRGYGAQAEHWQVRRRYNDFQSLHNRLKLAGFYANLPPKKLLGNFNRDFISHRLAGLQAYLREVLSQPLLATSLVVLTFLHPNGVKLDKSDEAKQLVSFYLRSTHQWDTAESFASIGWRLDKYHFGVRPVDDKKSELILTWTFYGPDLAITPTDLNEIFQRIRLSQNPFLSPIQASWFGDQGGLVVRNKYEKGSLRDVLRMATLNQFYLEKYGWSKPTSRLEPSQLRLYGRQILSGLIYLNELGVPFTNVHCGNLFLHNDQDIIQISGIEDDLSGLSSRYRPQFVQCKAVKSIEDMTVYSFGLSFYEMATGKQLKSAFMVSPPDCKENMAAFLNRILSSHATKTQLPKLKELFIDRLFDGSSDAAIACDQGTVSVTFSDSQRKLLDLSRETIEARLARDQVSFRRQENDQKFQHFISSDEGRVHMRSLSSQQVSPSKDESIDNSVSFTPSEESPSGSLHSGEVSLGRVTAGFVSPRSHDPTAPHNPPGGGIPPPPPPPPMPPKLHDNGSFMASASNGDGGGEQRNSLLDSVRNFNRSRLKTVDGQT